MKSVSAIVTTQPGIGPILRGEIVALTGLSASQLNIQPARNGDAVMLGSVIPQLLQLKTAEDVFAVLQTVPLTGAPEDLSRLRRVRLGLPRGLRVRVVVQADDAPWRRYRRVDMQQSLVTALLNSPNVKVVATGAQAEIWAHQIGRSLYISRRLSDEGMRHHGHRAVELPAALRPVVAAAMVRLTNPQPDDTFLDPMCGSGTILLERATAGRYRQLLGGDNDSAAVVAAKENFGRKHHPWTIAKGDATCLPLEDSSVSAIATNPPWGKQIGTRGDNQRLYPALLRETVRVLQPGGRLVLITNEDKLIRAALTKPALKLIADYSVVVLGQPATIFVMQKAAKG